MVRFFSKAKERFNDTVSNFEKRRAERRRNELQRLKEKRKIEEARATQFQGIASERQRIAKAKDKVRKSRGSFVDRVPLLRNVDQASFNEGVGLISQGSRKKPRRKTSKKNSGFTTIKVGGQTIKIQSSKKKAKKKRRRPQRSQPDLLGF